MVVNVKKLDGIAGVLDIERINELSTLLKVTAWVKKFVYNTKASVNKLEKYHGDLIWVEVVEAEAEWMRSVRAELRRQDNFEQLERKLGIVEEKGVLQRKIR